MLKKIFLSFFLSTLLSTSIAAAADFYWEETDDDSGTCDGDFSTADCWDTIGGTAAGSAPTSTDTAIINAGSANITMSNDSVDTLTVEGAFSGTINQSGTFAANTINISAGTINFTNSGNIEIGVANLSGVTTPGTITLSGSGTIDNDGTGGINIYGDLNISGSGTWDQSLATTSILVLGDINMTGGSVTNGDNTNLSLGGDFNYSSGTFSNTFDELILIGHDQALTGNLRFSVITKDINNQIAFLGEGRNAILSFENGSTTTMEDLFIFGDYENARYIDVVSSSPTNQYTIQFIDDVGDALPTFEYINLSDMNFISVDGGLVPTSNDASITGNGNFDAGNNTNIENLSPTIDPLINLGPTSLTDGSVTTDSTPTFSFDAQACGGCSFRLIVEIATDQNFENVVTHYASNWVDSITTYSFTVGQAADPYTSGSVPTFTNGTPSDGLYNTGSPGQTLSSNTYFWRVRTQSDIGDGIPSAYVEGFTSPSASFTYLSPASVPEFSTYMMIFTILGGLYFMQKNGLKPEFN